MPAARRRSLGLKILIAQQYLKRNYSLGSMVEKRSTFLTEYMNICADILGIGVMTKMCCVIYQDSDSLRTMD